MDHKPLVEIENVSKWFGANRALNGARLVVEPGRVHALVGVNGAGKSTLMKILAGVVQCDEGSIRIRGEEVALGSADEAEAAGISIVYQELSVIDDLNVTDNILLRHLPARGWVGRVNTAAGRKAATAALGRLGVQIDPDARAGDLPVGQKQLIEIAKALSVDASVVIFDEPTSALTDQETRALFDAVRRLTAAGAGVIYISHYLDEIFRIADEVTVLRDGRTVATRPIGEIDIAGLVELMLGSRNAIPPRNSHRLDGPPLLEVRAARSERLAGPINLTVHPGEIVGVCGQLGSGRTELLRAVYGADELDEGEILMQGNPVRPGIRGRVHAGIGMVPEERKADGIITESSILSNIGVASVDQLSRWGHVPARAERARATEASTRVGVVPNDVSLDIEALSGGNQQKAILGRWVGREGVKLLLLDEPTRGIDVGAKTMIYGLLDSLAAQGVGVLFATSDEEELLGLADRICVLRRGQIVHEAPASELDPHRLTTLIVGGEI